MVVSYLNLQQDITCCGECPTGPTQTGETTTNLKGTENKGKCKDNLEDITFTFNFDM